MATSAATTKGHALKRIGSVIEAPFEGICPFCYELVLPSSEVMATVDIDLRPGGFAHAEPCKPRRSRSAQVIPSAVRDSDPPGITILDPDKDFLIDPTIIIQNTYLNPERLIFEGIDTSQKPLYDTSGVAKKFGFSPMWLRGQQNDGYLVYNGVPLKPKRLPPKGGNEYGDRAYSLADIELVAHALAQHNRIRAKKLIWVLVGLWAEGHIYDYL